MNTTTYSIVTNQGTAMPEATLCERHFGSLASRAFAAGAALSAEDCDEVRWCESTGNDAVACVACSDGPGQDRWGE